MTKDILEFQQASKIIAKSKEKSIQKIMQMIQEILDRLLYGTTLKIYGSYACNLCLPWSPLDLIIISNTNNQKKIFDKNLLNNISSNIKNNTNILSINIDDDYLFPSLVFKTNEVYDKLCVRLSLPEQNQYNVLKSLEFMQNFLNSYPTLEPLNLVIKNFVKRLGFQEYPVS